jgi:hypothetical protein
MKIVAFLPPFDRSCVVRSGKGLKNIKNMKTFKPLFGILTLTCGLAVCGYSQSFLTNGLVAYYPFEGNANDLSTNVNNGTRHNAVLTTNRFGETAHAFQFNGTDAYVSAPNRSYLSFPNGEFTISLWATVDGSAPNPMFLAGLDNGLGQQPKWFIALGWQPNQLPNPSPSSYLSFGMTAGDGHDYYVPLTRCRPALGSWHQYLFTKVGTAYTLYIDGVPSGTNYMVDSSTGFTVNEGVVGPSAIPSGITAPLTIGWAEGGGYFNGKLDDVRIYSRALSSNEVAQLYAFESEPSCVSPPSGLVGWWPGEGNANDIAGTNNGTLSGGASFASGEVGQTFSFDGSTGYVQVQDSDLWAFGTNSFSVELWANFNAVPPGSLIEPRGGSFIGNDEGTGPMKKWMFALGGDLLHLSVYNPSGGQVWLVQAPFTPTPHQWYHLAVVRDGNVFTIFLNGVAVGSEANSIAVPNANAPLTIGHSEAFYFNGQLDEVSIYSRALTTNEIAAIYNASNAGKCMRPLIRAQPQSQVGYWGKSITLTVTAEGIAPLGYQWQKDGVPITGATGASLVLTNLQMTDAAGYTVVVTNLYGVATSAPAYLTMNPAGVSLALYAGITIDGVVGLTYGIQYSTDLSNTNGWRGMANVTLSVPTELWFDVQPASKPQRYYRVVPGPITIP